MDLGWLLYANVGSTPVEYVDNGGAYAYVVVGGIWEIFVHFSHSYYELKNSLKKYKVFK